MYNYLFGNQQVIIEQMTREQADLAVEWANQEGWNPGIHDAECFYNTDPTGFFVAKIDQEIVGTISIVKYSKDFGFGGFYIIQPELRRKGLGSVLFDFFKNYCQDFNVGVDGVLEMQQTYQKHGLIFSHKNTRYATTASLATKRSSQCVEIGQNDVAELIRFDEKFFSVSRPQFLECWVAQKDSSSFMVKDSLGKICGYGVIRKCFRGYKIGPLFSNSSDVAEAIFDSLISAVPGEEVFLDVPEVNLSAVSLANKNHMQPVFATVRMYTKYVPVLPLDKIYGVTSFELG